MALLTTCRAAPDPGPPPPGTLTLAEIPARPQGAPTGSQFAAATSDATFGERQQRAREELRRGNLPAFLHRFVPVVLQAESGGDTLRGIVWVSPDYLAVGGDDDFLRIPLTRDTATAVARDFGCVLPTDKIVDAIYRQAEVTVVPRPMRPGPLMRSNDYYLRHQRTIQTQLRGQRAGALVAGHKKDVVLTNRLNARPGRIAIYGWHRGDGDPIQPLSTVHTADYDDYSHGLRLVYGRAWVDGRWRSVTDLLQDPTLAPLLSHEGPIARLPTMMGQAEPGPWAAR